MPIKFFNLFNIKTSKFIVYFIFLGMSKKNISPLNKMYSLENIQNI